jgi:glycosyltransferase involved in cell wall biosynthesis
LVEKASDVSVIIPAYGTCPHLPQVLQAVLAQSLQPREIIVVHSGPGDPSESLRQSDERIRVIHREERVLAGGARNIGLRHAGGQWAAFLDSDVLPVRHWLGSLLAAAHEAPNRFVSGSIGFSTTGGYWGLCLWATEFSGVHPFLPAGEIEGGASASMLVPMEKVRQIGGFNGRFSAGEDSILATNLREIGLANWFQPRARVDHFNIRGIRHCLSHLFWMGRWSCICRRIKPLRGSLAARFWPLALGLWIAKLCLIYYRVFRWGEGYRLTFLGLAPGILVGLVSWNLGFLCGLPENVKSFIADSGKELDRYSTDHE